ncbi:hypothetical protein GWK47_006886 [Chionoecetes opilio]|uniref:Uncharacterized protein n=1 Tax=Chionoecetes opilio TaxID=41210 RepID=A0A8J4YF63_CHIOP|nr:hypothetical protein GWK47_006886 [Chionoecetes opilio]
MFGLQCGRRCPQRPPQPDCQLCPSMREPTVGRANEGVRGRGGSCPFKISCRVLASPPVSKVLVGVQQFLSSQRVSAGGPVFTMAGKDRGKWGGGGRRSEGGAGGSIGEKGKK